MLAHMTGRHDNSAFAKWPNKTNTNACHKAFTKTAIMQRDYHRLHQYITIVRQNIQQQCGGMFKARHNNDFRGLRKETMP